MQSTNFGYTYIYIYIYIISTKLGKFCEKITLWKGRQFEDTSVKPNAWTKHFQQIPKANDYSQSNGQNLAKNIFVEQHPIKNDLLHQKN
jgi:hypothetical protein